MSQQQRIRIDRLEGALMVAVVALGDPTPDRVVSARATIWRALEVETGASARDDRAS